jgi:hypothetical protein
MINSYYYIYVTDGSGVQIASSITIQDAQVNIGSTAKPYFPTTDRLNVARLTYQNGGGGCPSLLLEKQSTNYSLWSNDLTQTSVWQNQTSNTTITQITSGGPDGGSFTRLVSTGSGSQGRIVQGGSITNPNGATMSVYLKGSGDTAFGLFIGNGISQYQQITLTNTWTRYVVSVSGVGGTYQDWQINCVGGSTIDVSFVQVEVSNYATSPIPTTSSSATRVADAFALKDITGFSIGNAYTILLDVTMQSSDNNRLFFETRTSTNTTSLTARNFNGALRLFNNIDASYPLAAVSSSTNKWAVRINGTSYDLFAVSGGVATKDSATITTARNFGYFELAGSTTQLYFDELVIFPTALTDAECQSLVL